MNHKLFITICAIASVCAGPAYSQNGSFTNMQTSAIAQSLDSALYKIGGTSSDIGQMGITGKPPSDLVKTYTHYASDSDDSKYNLLTQSERNSLVFFGYKLQSKGAISDSSMKSLMVAEKMRAGMPKAQIKVLMDLVETIKANPNYELTYEDVMTVDSAASFINTDPYAFSDVLGTLLGPILHAPSEIQGISTDTETILINAAKTITGLNQDQMDNLQNISDTYQGSQQFDPTEENVTDVNQVIETAYYPDSANLLLPFLGADALIAMSAISYAYPASFHEETVNEYSRTVVRDPVVVDYNRDGVYPRYNENWSNNRTDAWEHNSDNRSQAWENNSDNRSQTRQDNSSNRSDARENGSDNRSSDRQSRSSGRSR